MKLRLPRSILTETLRMAIDSLRGHKFRSFLTVLGIVIGVLTAILIASIITGMRQSIIGMIEEYGTNNIYASISRRAQERARIAPNAPESR